MKWSSVGITFLCLLCICFSSNGNAVTLLTEEDALVEMFPDVDEVVSETVTLTAEKLSVVKERLGGSLVHFQKGSKSENVAETAQITLHYGIKDGKKVRMAIIDVQPGKWGPVVFIVAIDTATATVQNMAVMSYVEKRGRPIARKNFLKQFLGKGSSDHISVRSGKGVRVDIRAVSGATISSDATCFSVKKVIAIYEEVSK
jgi:Na+-translocating ferredoxin:NAD+ oxidoreductase RnfG subunit